MIMHGSGCSLDAHQRPEKPASGCGGGTRVAQHRAGWLAGGTGERRLRGEYLGTQCSSADSQRRRVGVWLAPAVLCAVGEQPSVACACPAPLVGSGQLGPPGSKHPEVPKSEVPKYERVSAAGGHAHGAGSHHHRLGDDASPPPPPDTAVRGTAARGRIRRGHTRRLRGDQRSLRHDVLRDERDGIWHPQLHPALRHRLHVLSQLRRVRTGRHALHACC